MSTPMAPGPAKAPERPAYAAQAGRSGGPFGGQRVAEKSLNFLPSLRRLLGELRPERWVLLGAVVLTIVGIGMSVLGPRILGMATDIIVTGVTGRGRLDFTGLRNTLLLALGLYVVSSLVLLLQGYLLNGAVQRSVRRLRDKVEAKIHRLPLSYFDRQTRGELLSRVTNDIDNVAQSLQQTLSQLLTSLLTVVGVTVMMFIISPVLAVIALVTIPVAIGVTTVIGKRAQRLFVAQWKATGELNSHIEEAFTGQSLVKVFGRQREVEQVFADRNDDVYRASFGAQFVSGLIMPTMFFIGNLNYVVIAVVGGLRVASGTMTLGDVQA
ncbi:MAG: ABC transporter ATP-binding protein, partial [Janthinobacterium lividum]